MPTKACDLEDLQCVNGRINNVEVIGRSNELRGALCAVENRLDGNADDISALQACCDEMRACCNDLTARVENLENKEWLRARRVGNRLFITSDGSVPQTF